jgi:ribosomal protein L30E
MANIKTFVKNGKRYRIVFVATTPERAKKALNMYQMSGKVSTTYSDTKRGKYYVGVRSV